MSGPRRDALELRDRMPHGLEQALHLVVLPLVERHLDPGVPLGFEQAHAIDRHALALDPDAAPAAAPASRRRGRRGPWPGRHAGTS